ncbi:hypothetical protein PCE1_001939 [Barthelona sp. PCE]
MLTLYVAVLDRKDEYGLFLSVTNSFTNNIRVLSVKGRTEGTFLFEETISDDVAELKQNTSLQFAVFLGKELCDYVDVKIAYIQDKKQRETRWLRSVLVPVPE